MRQFRLVQIWS